MGMLAQEGSGLIRIGVRDERGMVIKTKAKKRKRAGGQSTVRGGQTTDGGRTSVYAMTPYQGYEVKDLSRTQASQSEAGIKKDYFAQGLQFAFAKKDMDIDDEDAEPPTKKRRLN